MVVGWWGSRWVEVVGWWRSRWVEVVGWWRRGWGVVVTYSHKRTPAYLQSKRGKFVGSVVSWEGRMRCSCVDGGDISLWLQHKRFVWSKRSRLSPLLLAQHHSTNRHNSLVDSCIDCLAGRYGTCTAVPSLELY